MGIGHYHAPQGRTVWLEPYEELPEFDEKIRYLWEDAWEDLTEQVRESLSPRFVWYGKERLWRDDAQVIARSKLHDVTVHENSYGYAYVSVRPRDDLNGSKDALAAANVEAVARKLFGALSEFYTLRVGWGNTPSPY